MLSHLPLGRERLPFLALSLTLAALLVAPALASAQPAFSKSFSPATIGPGASSALRFEIANPTFDSIRDVAFTDTLPSGLTIASPANVMSTCFGTVDAPAGGDTITFSGGGAAAMTTCFITVDVTGSAAGTYSNVSSAITSDAGTGTTATADLVIATDRPGFSKAFSPSTVLFEGRSTLVFTIDNGANGSDLFNLRFTDNLPAGMVIASPANASTTCSKAVVTATAGGTDVSLAPDPTQVPPQGFLAAGASCTVSVDVLGNSVGPLGNTSGELTSQSLANFQTLSSGKASATLAVTVDRLALAKRFLGDPVPAGGTVDLEFTVRNLTRDTSVSSLAFTDDLDAALSGLVATGLPLANPCGAGSSLTGTSTLTLAGGNLPAEGSCTFTVTLAVPTGAVTGSYVNTTSQLTGDLGGRPATGSAASDTLFVAPVPVLASEFVDDPVGAGGSVTYEFTLVNTSTSQTATSMSFTDELDGLFASASNLPAGGFCGGSSSALFVAANQFNPAQLVFQNMELAPGASCTFSVTLAIDVTAPTGTFTDTTSPVTATIGGQGFTGNAASADVVVVGALGLSKQFVGDPAAPGDTISLELTVSLGEDAPGDATDIAFTDNLDAALSGLVASGTPLADVCGIGSSLTGTMTLSLTGGSLAPGESCTFSVDVVVPADGPAGAHTNTTSAITGDVGGVATVGIAATDDLDIAGVVASKEFLDDPVLPGGQVTLRFTLTNESPVSAATGIAFQDNLNATLSNLSAASLPGADPCGVGSSLIAANLDRLLVLSGGSLDPGASCSFDVVLDVPASTLAGGYTNQTSAVTATIDGSVVAFDPATDDLTVESDILSLTKEFVDDPVEPGSSATLRFVVSNASAGQTVTDIGFSDDLDAALAGLQSTSGTLPDVCGTGSTVSGTGVVALSGGSLAPGASCTFDVTVAVPATGTPGTLVENVTSPVTGSVDGIGVEGDAASDVLEIRAIAFSKAFGAGPVYAGDTVTLTFTIENMSASSGIGSLAFFDDLSAVLFGLVATDTPQADVCGEGSSLTGTDFLTLTGGSLPPGGSCTFSVTLQVPGGAAVGSYDNTTSDLFSNGLPVAEAASDTLVVEELVIVDSDGDGVLDGDDLCPGTTIPESVPTRRMGVNRYALVDGDTTFDTTSPPGNGNGPGDLFTTEDTGGCSCEQIIDILDLGQGHVKNGCSLGVMRDWVEIVNGG